MRTGRAVTNRAMSRKGSPVIASKLSHLKLSQTVLIFAQNVDIDFSSFKIEFGRTHARFSNPVFKA